MPFYDFRCEECGKLVEDEFFKITDNKCIKCCGIQMKQVILKAPAAKVILPVADMDNLNPHGLMTNTKEKNTPDPIDGLSNLFQGVDQHQKSIEKEIKKKGSERDIDNIDKQRAEKLWTNAERIRSENKQIESK
jgi:hypothetical protein